MITFHSANTRAVNSERAANECFETAFPDGVPADCRIIIFQASVGHKLEKLGAALKTLAPGAVVLGNTCGGVIGREGVGDSLHEVGIMAVCGRPEECVWAFSEDMHSANAAEKGMALAEELRRRAPFAPAIYLLCPGIDMKNDAVLNAFRQVYGDNAPIFGGTSGDNKMGIVDYQYADGQEGGHNAWAVVFADESLRAVTRATHGFKAFGEAMVATRVEGNRILELDGRPAGSVYRERLSVSPDSPLSETIPFGALAEALPPDLAEEYGNPHILRLISHIGEDGSMYYPVTLAPGTPLWLTTRDEDLIFSEQKVALAWMRGKIGSGDIAAVFQADCLARGHQMFERIVKEGLVGMIQEALADKEGETPPWLGMYGFGEYAQLGGRNMLHNYTTSLMALYRAR